MPHRIDLDALAARRKRTFRQLLLTVSRLVNARIVDGLIARGHVDVRLAHTALISSLDFEGTSISVLAERANMTTQGMGQLATELEERGYIERQPHASDGRSKTVRFTDSGWALLLDCFEIAREIDEAFVQALGRERVDAFRETLVDLSRLAGDDGGRVEPPQGMPPTDDRGAGVAPRSGVETQRSGNTKRPSQNGKRPDASAT